MQIRIAILIFLLPILAKGQVNIQIALGGLSIDSIYIGKTFGKKLIKERAIAKNEAGIYVLSSETDMPAGVYTVIYEISRNTGNFKSFNILIDKQNKQYNLYCDAYRPRYMPFMNSQENTNFNNFFIKFDSIIFEYKKANLTWLSTYSEPNFDALAKIEQALKAYVKETIKSYPKNFTGEFAKRFYFDFPEYSGSLADKSSQRQNFFSGEFSQGLDLQYTELWQTPLGVELLDIFLLHSSEGNYKTLESKAIQILNLLKVENPKMYEYYLTYLLNTFPNITKYAYELATIGIYDNFIVTGQAPFLSDQELRKINDLVSAYKRLCPGNVIPDLKLYQQNGIPYQLHEAKSNYNMFVVWSSDCNHCQKELPLIQKIEQQYKDKDLQIITLCAKRGEGVKSCYEYLKLTGTPTSWVNLNDDKGYTAFPAKLNVTTFPLVYIFDKDKKIIFRQVGEIEEIEFHKVFAN